MTVADIYTVYILYIYICTVYYTVYIYIYIYIYVLPHLDSGIIYIPYTHILHIYHISLHTGNINKYNNTTPHYGPPYTAVTIRIIRAFQGTVTVQYINCNINLFVCDRTSSASEAVIIICSSLVWHDKCGDLSLYYQLLIN